MYDSTRQGRIRVWDLPTRIFHWSLVALIAFSWASFEFSEEFGDTSLFWHRLSGYAILVLVIWRVIWGITGSPASRFTTFLAWPSTVARYAANLVRGREAHYLGHNPLGSYMILALLVTVTTQAMFGLFSTEHNFVTWGPLSNLVSESTSELLTNYHVWMFDNVLLILIGLHIVANIAYRIVRKDRLIEAMVIGSKPAGDYVDFDAVAPADESATTTASRRNTLFRAVLCLALAIAIFVGTIVGFGGKLIY
ncbi:MAG: cytochrome b/b6 domain-containing protein [Alphaproteobacteria bacterium]|nr:cytochrome b/b6 domain-containing protein [Alphaproteobacteria bacterium]